MIEAMRRLADMKNIFLGLAVMIVVVARVAAADPKALYEQNFDKAELDKVPDDMLVLEGSFVVKEEGGARFLELPGAPLETFGVLFGPTETNGIAVRARIHGTLKGRRSPTFGVGLNGVGGYRLQVSPGKKLIELYKGDEMLASAPFGWESGSWTILQLQSRTTKAGEIKIDGKAWKQGAAEPKEWTLSHSDRAGAPAGRPSIWGSPYAGTPIRFDDFVVSRVTE
jgi:hypothetical protein